MKAGHSKAIYFLTDALGSVRDIVSGTDGAVLQSYDYTENGDKTSSTSLKSDKTWVGGLSVNDDVGDSGLYLMGHRHYDPSLGRFLSRDPIGFAGGLNLYEYAGSSPASNVDPSGLEKVDIVSSVTDIRALRKNILINVTTTALTRPYKIWEGGPTWNSSGAPTIAQQLADIAAIQAGVKISVSVDARVKKIDNNSPDLWVQSLDCPPQEKMTGPLTRGSVVKTIWIPTPYDNNGRPEFYDRYKIHISSDLPGTEKVVGGQYQLSETINLEFHNDYHTIDLDSDFRGLPPGRN